MTDIPTRIAPFSEEHSITSEEELTEQFATALACCFGQSGVRARGPDDNAVPFGHMVASLRRRRAIGKLALSREARLNPIYLAMLEHGLLEPEDIPPAVVAKLSLCFARRLDEWPILPWAKREDGWQVVPGKSIFTAGLRFFGNLLNALMPTLSPVRVQFRGSTPREGPAKISLPPTQLESDGQHWLLECCLVRTASGWWLEVLVRDARGRLPVVGKELGLYLGSQGICAMTDASGVACFEVSDPTAIVSMEFFTPGEAKGMSQR